MTHYWRQITVMIVGHFYDSNCVVFIGNAKKDTEAFNITEALRTAAISNKDDSARIQPGAFIWIKPALKKSSNRRSRSSHSMQRKQ